jgi:hypothetical protein
MGNEKPKSGSQQSDPREGDYCDTEERPVPSQAEGDRETIEEDLKEKLGNKPEAERR